MISYNKLFRKLEEKGFTTYKIRKTKLIGNSTYQRIKGGEGGVDYFTLNRLCRELDCQPGDLMEYVPDGENEGANEKKTN